jgi:pSer/pThr/pTyr-binding forkhead associated (FHA) protein
MWTLRFLNGPLTGKSISLQASQVIGRDPMCDIVLSDPGVSKRHAELRIENGELWLKDLGSSNGTYVNGVRIQRQELQLGDKVGFYQFIAEVGIGQKSLTLVSNHDAGAERGLVPKGDQLPSSPPWALGQVSAGALGTPSVASTSASDWNHTSSGPESPKAPTKSQSASTGGDLFQKAQEFVERKILPDVVSLSDRLSLKGLFLTIASLFILLVSILSVLPMYIVTQDSVKQESFLRALSVARAVASVNEERMRTEGVKGFVTELIYKEPGVEDVYLIGPDGVVVAPMELAGSLPKHVSFAREVRGRPREFARESGGLVMAAVPVMAFDSRQQMNVAKAHVVVAYRPEVLKFNDERVFGLFVQVLLIGFIVGALLFFSLYKVVEYLFRHMYQELEKAVRAGADQIEFRHKLPLLEELVTLINQVLTFAKEGQRKQDAGSAGGVMQRTFQLRNLCDMIPYPSLLVSVSGTIDHVNLAFRSLMDLPSEPGQAQPTIYQIPDQAVQKNFEFILKNSTDKPDQPVHDELEIAGNVFVVSGQMFSLGELGQELCLIRISPKEAA